LQKIIAFSYSHSFAHLQNILAGFLHNACNYHYVSYLYAIKSFKTIMPYLHTNLKFLRKQTKDSQEAFGKLFNLTRGQVDSYERKVATPKTELIGKIAAHYKTTIEVLMTKDLVKNPGLLHAAGEHDGEGELIAELRNQIAYLQKQNEKLTGLLAGQRR
jgi:transcriptional regulator with XRE-family HTH domain